MESNTAPFPFSFPSSPNLWISLCLQCVYWSENPQQAEKIMAWKLCSRRSLLSSIFQVPNLRLQLSLPPRSVFYSFFFNKLLVPKTRLSGSEKPICLFSLSDSKLCMILLWALQQVKLAVGFAQNFKVCFHFLNFIANDVYLCMSLWFVYVYNQVITFLFPRRHCG